MDDLRGKTLKESKHYCPTCKKELRRIDGKMGPFWGCSGFPSCSTTLNDIAGKPTDKIDEHYRCPICTRRLVRAAKEKGDYWYCSGYTKGCKVSIVDKEGSPEQTHRCPQCGNLLVRRDSKNGFFWGCSQFPRCKSTFRDIKNRPDFDLFAT